MLVRLFTALFVLLVPFAAAAEEVLDGAQIQAALEGKTALYDDGTKQYFDAHGWTVYIDVRGVPDRGKWRIQGNQYCSWWEMGGWACYDVTGAEERISFIGPSSGATYKGRLVAGDQTKS